MKKYHFALGACIAVPLLLTADYSFARAGLGQWAPVSTIFSVIGLTCLLAMSYVMLVRVVLRGAARTTRLWRAFARVLLVAMVGWGEEITIVHFGEPIAQRKAWEVLADGLGGVKQFSFAEHLSAADKARILASRSGDWRLAFVNTLKTGFDFVLVTGNGKLLGARVILPDLTRPDARLWAYEETSFVVDASGTPRKKAQ